MGYVIKKPGTSCFFVEPEIYDYMKWISNLARSLGLELLPEVHAHHSVQQRLAERGYWTYDFVLPYLVLDSLLFKRSGKLKKYLRERPARQVTMLDCHDGIPVKPDMDGIVEGDEARRLVDICMQRGGNLSRIMSATHRDPGGFDVHQIRISYYSALGCDDDAYLSARAIQFFAPGVPQVYYVGLLAGENDLEGVRRAGGEGRAISRHDYTLREIEEAIQKPVVQRLVRLMRFRNSCAAFNGTFQVLESDNSVLRLAWTKAGKTCTLDVDLQTRRSVIAYVDDSGRPVEYRV